jgi:hypothetical protein
MAQSAWVIPSSSIESVNKARASISALMNMLTYLKTELTAKFAPIIVKTVDMIIRAARMLDIIVKGSIGWKNAIIGISAALAVMNAGFLLSPIGLFTAGIVLLMAVLEDLYVYSKGGDSLLGDLVKSFPALGKILDSTFGVFKDIGAAIQAILGGNWGKFDEIINKWGIFGDIIIGVASGLKIIKDILTTIYDLATGKITLKEAGAKASDTGEFYLDALKKMWLDVGKPGEKTGGVFGGGFDMMTGLFDKVFGGNQPALAGATTNNITISVDGSGTPNATAIAVQERINAELQKTYNQTAGRKKEK